MGWNKDSGNQSFWHWGSPLPPFSPAEKSPALDTGKLNFRRGGNPLPIFLPFSTDSGVGTDSSNVVHHGTDSGTGTDASTVTTGATVVSVVDSGTGTDASTEHAALPRSDASTGSDASTEHAVYGQTDSGTGDDESTVTTKVEVDVTDSGTGDDESTLTLPTAVNVDDSGVGDDESTKAQSFAQVDSGSGSDISIELAFAGRTDSGTGSEVSTLHAVLSRTDSATDAEVATVNGNTFLSRTDSCHGTEASTLHVAHSRTDNGVGTDKGSFPVNVTDSATSSMDASVLHANIGQRASTGEFVTRQYDGAFDLVIAPVPTFPHSQDITLSQNAIAGNKLILTMAHNADLGGIDTVSSAGLTWHILGEAHNSSQTLVVAYADIGASDLLAGYAITIHYTQLCTRQNYILDEITGVEAGGPVEFSIVEGHAGTTSTGTSGISPTTNDMVLGHFSYETGPTDVESEFTPGAGYHMDKVSLGFTFSTTGPTAITEYKNGAGAHIVADVAFAGTLSWWIAAYTVWLGVPASVALDTGVGTDNGTATVVPDPTPPPPAHGFIVLRGRMTIKAGVGVLS